MSDQNRHVEPVFDLVEPVFDIRAVVLSHILTIRDALRGNDGTVAANVSMGKEP